MISRLKIDNPLFFDLVFLGWSNFLLFVHVRNFVDAGFITSVILSFNNPENENLFFLYGFVSILLAILSLTLMIANNLIFFLWLTDRRTGNNDNAGSFLGQIIFLLPIYLIFWLVNTIIINRGPYLAVIFLLLVPAIAFFFCWKWPEREAELERREKRERNRIYQERYRIKKRQKEIEDMKALQKAKKIRKINEIYGKKMADAYEKNSIAIGMPLSLVEEIMGPGYEKKETVTKVCEKASYKFGKFIGSRGGVHYEKTIDFENGLCVGWKDL